MSHHIHLKQKHLWGKFKCTVHKCSGSRINFAQDIVAHMENHELTENIYYNKEPYVHCPNCKDTLLIKNIVSHYEKCVKENCQIFECPSCKEKFENINMLNRHWM